MGETEAQPAHIPGKTEYATVTFANIDVSYYFRLDGGGQDFGQDYLRAVRTLPTKPKRVFEWCSGPAFIGFSMLAHGLCDSLCLADVNPEAVEACRYTVKKNNLGDRVSVYHSDNLDGIPKSEKWDLVVSNPPHSGTNRIIREWGNNPLIYMDNEWQLHRRFWRRVKQNLNPSGVVLIQENSNLSRVSDFSRMIENNGMRIAFVGDLGPPYSEVAIYYIGAVREEDASTMRGIGLAQQW